MLAIGLTLLAVGVVAAVVCFFWKRSSDKTAGWWTAVAAVDIETALDAGDGIAVAVTGTTVAPAGPDGAPQKDPTLGTPAAWWRETVTEHWEERVRVNRSGNDSGPDHRWEERSNTISSRESTAPFVVRDGGRDLTITLRDLDVEGELLQSRADRVAASDGAASGEGGLAATILAGLTQMTADRRDHYVETRIDVLPDGVPVLVAGRMAGTTLVADAEHRLQVCEGTVEERLGESLKSAGRARLGLIAAGVTAGIGALLSVVGAIVG